MNAESPASLGATRARISPRACPTCDGTGRVPSRQVVGVSLACPACSSARDDFAVVRPEPASPGAGASRQRALRCSRCAGRGFVWDPTSPDNLAPCPDCASPAAWRVHEDLLTEAERGDDAGLWRAVVLFLAGSACGAVFGLLVAGVFRVLS